MACEKINMRDLNLNRERINSTFLPAIVEFLGSKSFRKVSNTIILFGVSIARFNICLEASKLWKREVRKCVA